MIKGVLLDLAGVLYVGDHLIPGAVQAVHRLHDLDLPVGFATNTTRLPKQGVIERLKRLGLTIAADDLVTPAAAARTWLDAHDAAPHLLIHPALEPDFAGIPHRPNRAVIVGDAGQGFAYDTMNAAFRALMDGAGLLALAKNRYFRDEDDQLSLDAGGFVAALEYAAGRNAVVLGKPAAAFYEAASARLGCNPGEVVMVGDDVETDVSGALAAGIGHALLVRTGKYHPSVEDTANPPPTAMVADIGAAVDWIAATLKP